MRAPCPPREDLVRHAHGELSSDLDAVVREHLTGCDVCRAVVSAVLAPTVSTGATPQPFHDSPALPTGMRLERFVLLRELGSGGMGRVYAAWDSRLERRVALKVVKHDVMARLENQRAALMNEARAMAQLAHPNVVTVHDIFEADGQLVIAMEFVDASTLRAWAGTHPDPAARWSALFDAGRGLAAAHEQGVLHRDFKPDNVLVDRNDRAQVADFGLARTSRGDGSPVFGGTPGYLAPEALRGEPLDVRVDQFAFAVTAWELLTGKKPTAGETSGPLTAREAAVLQRAMHARPAERFESMQALLSALAAARDWPRRRARRTAFAAAVLALAAAGGWALQRERAACADGQRLAAPLLDDARLGAITAAFEKSGLPNAKNIATKLVGLTRERAVTWREGWATACRAARSAPVGGASLEEARMHCYERALINLDVATEEWTRGSREVLDQASLVFDQYSSPDACDQVSPESYLVLPADEALARELVAQRREVDRLWMRSTFASQEQALQLRAEVQRVVEDTSAPGKEGLQSAAATLLAFIDMRFDRAEQSASAMAALRASLAAGDYSNGVYAAIALAHGRLEAGDGEEGLRWVDVGDGLERRIDSWRLQGELALARASTLKALKRFDEALDANRRANELYEKKLEPDSLQLAISRNNYAGALYDRGRLDEARVLYVKALEVKRARLGPDNPSLLPAIANLASLDLDTGHFAESLEGNLAVLEKLTPVDGKPHRRRANVLNGVVTALMELGRVSEARTYADEALGQPNLLPELRGRVFRIAAEVSVGERDFVRAERELAAADEAFREAKLDGNPATVAMMAYLRGELAWAQGKADEARSLVDVARNNLRPENTPRLRKRIEALAEKLAPPAR